MKKSTTTTVAEALEFSPTDYINNKRWVPGLASVSAGYRVAYPTNVYNIDGDDRSGIVGTLFPDGTFTRLAESKAPYSIEAWDDGLKHKVPHTVSWDGGVAGSIELAKDTESPHRRLWDGSLTGDWPLSPPRPPRAVNSEKMREAAKEHMRERKQENRW